ncbi:MAG: DUF4861 domain-containing protein [Bacteroidetes bacterium]|nr:DUF4861 domain-containing protein [Bacteroidota bacterium]
MLHSKSFSLIIILLFCICRQTFPETNDWYTQENFIPQQRIEITIYNDLEFNRIDCPVIIIREDFPIQDIHKLWITVVDPGLPPSHEPSKEILALSGAHQLRKETNGHAMFHQLNDLDKDGIWDELFFMTDIRAKASKKLYIYLGYNVRGWNKHGTHAGIGSYCRHLVPFWKSEHVG